MTRVWPGNAAASAERRFAWLTASGRAETAASAGAAAHPVRMNSINRSGRSGSCVSVPSLPIGASPLWCRPDVTACQDGRMGYAAVLGEALIDLLEGECDGEPV